MKQTVSIFTTSQGHLSIASAIKQALQPKFTVYQNHHIGPEIHAYNLLYRYSSDTSIPLYQLTNHHPKLLKPVNIYSSLVFGSSISQEIKNQKPHLLINTWYFLNHFLSTYTQSHPKVPLITTVSNPRTIHTYETNPQAYHLVFDAKAQHTCISYTHQPHRTIITGWFTQPEYYQKYDQNQAKINLGLKPNLPTFTLVSGSEGTLKIIKLLPRLARTPKPFQLIISCGHNKQLQLIAKQLSKSLIKSGHRVIVLGHQPNLIPQLQAADLVIGKAGPNTIFESVATRTPFLATSHLVPHETGNLDIIRDYHLGFVEENPSSAVNLILKITNQPQMLSSFHKPLQKLAAYNQQAPQKLLHLINQLL